MQRAISAYFRIENQSTANEEIIPDNFAILSVIYNKNAANSVTKSVQVEQQGLNKTNGTVEVATEVPVTGRVVQS